MNKILYNTIKYTTYASLFTPLIVSRSFLFPFVVPRTLFFWATAEIIFFAWILLAIFDKSFRPKYNILFCSVLFFLAIMAISSFLGVNLRQSLWGPIERMTGLIAFFHLTAYFTALFSTFKTKREWNGVFAVAVFAGMIVSFLFLLQRFGEVELFLQARLGATLGNSSFMGSYLIFPAFLSLYLLMGSFERENKASHWESQFYDIKKIILRIFSGVGFIMMALAIISSTARAVRISFVGGLVLLMISGLYAWTRYGSHASFAKQLKILFIALFILIIILGAMVFYGTFWEVEAITKHLPGYFSSGTVAGRLAVWRIAWEGIKERPIFGWGPENFIAPFTKYYDPCLGIAGECGGETMYDRTHNIVFDMLIFGGFFGLISYVLLFVSMFYVLITKVASKWEWILSSIIAVLLVVYSVQNFMVFDMTTTYVMMFLVLAFVASDHITHNT